MRLFARVGKGGGEGEGGDVRTVNYKYWQVLKLV